MLTFMLAVLAIAVIVFLALFGSVALAMWGAPLRLALWIHHSRRARRLRRLLPSGALLFVIRLTPVGGGMGNLLVGGPNFYGGTGVPTDAAVGGSPANGDFYFRVDGAGTTCIYQRRAAAWVATAA